MILLTILGVAVAAVLVLSVIGVVIGGSALIIGFGDIILYGLIIVIIVKSIIKARKENKSKKRKKK